MSRAPATVVVVALVAGPALTLAPVAAGCARLDDGRTAFVQIDGATFVPGALPDEDRGPAVLTATAAHAVVAPGTAGEPLSATLAAGAFAAAVGARGDEGWWIVPAGPPDPLVPDLPTLDVQLAFAAAAPEGPLELVVLAADARGAHGDAVVVPFVVQRPAPVAGPLVVTLGWDNDADLDLHVLLPDGVEVWSGNVNSYERPGPGEPADPPTASRDGAVLDVDSNANCVADGRRLENVVWPIEPAAGRYVVRVASSSLCGEASAQWWVSVRRGDEPIAAVRGRALSTDTRGPHGAGAGVLAVEFTIDEPVP
ncbi:MAG: hypothetical protein FJ137_18145 [Deltaproteobacteria bacterium]|nr:hypothetical protein [Deltaproteobacteria bacterium]